MNVLLNTVRNVDRDQARERLLGSEKALNEKVPVAQLNPVDIEKLGLSPSLNILISTKYGSVIMKYEKNKKIPEGIVNVPVSIWANQLTGIEDFELDYKNIKAEIEGTKDPVLSINQLIQNIKS